MPTERVILATTSDDEEDDLYKGYNEYNPILDTRNLQNDEIFRETISKSSYGRLGTRQRLATSTAGVAFNRRSTALKSRKATNTAAARSSHGLLPNSNRPLTAVRGAGYTSTVQSAAMFDPLKLASKASISAASKLTSDFRLQDENAAEFKVRQLELQIGKTLEESAVQAESGHYAQALDLAKDCVQKERSFNRLKEQNGLLEQFGTNSDLTLATLVNLSEQYTNIHMWPEAINVLQSILKNRSFTNIGRFRLNIGVIYFRQGEYPKAIKFFRMALDQVPQTSTNLRLKIMQNIGLAFVKLQQFADAIASFEYIASERGELDAQTAFHLIVCYYALGDVHKMRHFFDKLIHVKIQNQFEDRYGHHEVLNNGGTLFDSNSGVTILSPADVMSSFEQQNSSVRPSSPILLIRDQHDHNQNLLLDVIRNDRLRQLEKTKIQNAEWCILTAAKLIAPFITMNSEQNEEANNKSFSLITSGLNWCIEQLHKSENDSFYLPISGNVNSNTNNSNDSTNVYSSSFTSGINLSNLADELELYKSVQHLRAREFNSAITTLKIFEKKDKLLGSAHVSSSERLLSENIENTNARSISSAMAAIGTSQNSSTSSLGFVNSNKIMNTSSSIGNSRVAATAATNLSFLYLLQNDISTAARYADEAIQIDRYNFGALLNRGNVYFIQGYYDRAAEFYREVIQTSASSLEAQYNLALAEKKLQNYEVALETLFRLRLLAKAPLNMNTENGSGRTSHFRQRISNTIEVQLLYQIGTIYESMNNMDQAVDFYQQVLNIVPSDVSLLVKLADIASENNDRKQALSYLMDAHRFLPSHIPTLERLSAYYIEVKMYEKAIKFMEKLSNIQPDEIKWQMMIAASHRRAGNYQQSFNKYQSIHERFPENSDCLKFLIRISTEFAEDNQSGISGSRNYAKLAEEYMETLKRIEKNRELREQQQAQQQQSNSRSTSRASGRASGASNPINYPTLMTNGSRDGSATTASSGSSSGYMSKSKSIKSPILGYAYQNTATTAVPSPHGIEQPSMNRAAISAIVDQVVEQLDNGALNERPTTSWSHRKDRLTMSATQKEHNFDDDDLLLDANLDDILPD